MSFEADIMRMHGGAGGVATEPLAVAVALEENAPAQETKSQTPAPASVPLAATTTAQQRAGQRSLAVDKAAQVKLTPIGKK